MDVTHPFELFICFGEDSVLYSTIINHYHYNHSDNGSWGSDCSVFANYNRPLKTKCNITLIKENTTISSPLLCYNTRPQSHFTLSLYVHLFGILLMIMFSFFPIKPLESSSEKIPLAFHIHHAAGRCTNSRPLRGEANPTHGPEAALAPPRSLSIRNIQRFYLSLWKKERAPRG